MPIDEIEVIKQKLVDQIKPIGVYLFGSFANGTAHADSDFDFYIIVDDNEKDLHAVATSAITANTTPVISAISISCHSSFRFFMTAFRGITGLSIL